MERLALIVNPLASRVTPARTRLVADVLRARAEATLFLTEYAGHATEIAYAASNHFDGILVYAGDGGFNEVLNGLDDGPPVGFIPGGGTSVLPRALGLPTDPVRAARQIGDALAAGRTRRISLGRVNGRRFGFAAGLGLDAEVVRRIDARGRSGEGRRPGDLQFALTVGKILAERRGRLPAALELKGLGRAAFALVANAATYTYAGRLPVRAAPEARFELGLDVVAPARVTPRSLPRLLAYALAGRGQSRARDVLYGHDLDRLEIVCDEPMPLQVDGEDLGDVTRALFESERDTVAVLV